MAPTGNEDGGRRGRLVIIAPNRDLVTETYVRVHVERLTAYFDVLPVYGYDVRLTDPEGRPLWPATAWLGARAGLGSPLGLRLFSLRLGIWLRSVRADAILCELGQVGARAIGAATWAGVPLFVMFRGADATVRSTVERYRDAYRRLLAEAAGVFAVAPEIGERLRALGAPAERLHLAPGGVDPQMFHGGEPERAPPIFVAVGRMVEKKAPYLTVLAFAEVARRYPEARLRMIGAGPLLDPTRRLAAALGIGDQVDFLGAQPPGFVAFLLRGARAFVQHSLEAGDGNREGTPYSIMEAQMTGLPVVATRHAGIPDIMVEGVTGYLVAEGDAATMGERMLALAADPALAGRLGRAGRERTIKLFSLQSHLDIVVPPIRAAMAARSS